MQNIDIICLGKLKEHYLCEAANEYIKRLSPYCKLTITELAAQRLPDDPSKAQIDAALSAEAKTVLSRLPQNAYIYALCIEGKQLSSEELSKSVQTAFVNGKSSAAFVIGSSYGLDESVKNRADFLLSFSKMTFPHQLMRIILLEQIYRSYQIDKGGKYHK